MQQSAHTKRKTPLTSHLPIIRIFTRYSTALLESHLPSIPRFMVSGGVSLSVLGGGVSGQLHAPATLFSQKVLSLPVNRRLCGPDALQKCASGRCRGSNRLCSLVTVLTELSPTHRRFKVLESKWTTYANSFSFQNLAVRKYSVTK
jgi:hypothetical protein